MDRCILREDVQRLRLEARNALHADPKTEEQKSALERFIINCEDALKRVSKSGRLDYTFAKPVYEFLDKHPEVVSLIEKG